MEKRIKEARESHDVTDNQADECLKALTSVLRV